MHARGVALFGTSDQSGSEQATGYRGFYYHSLEMQRDTRVRRSEVSLIDSALLDRDLSLGEPVGP